MAAAANGVSFETFYRDNYQKAVYYIQKKIGSQDDAEELACQVFLYAYEHFSTYDAEKASLSTWLYVIINSRIKNWYRDHREHADIDELASVIPDDSEPLDAALLLQEERAVVAAALEQLSERDRTIIILRYFKNLPGEEIARRMGMSHGSLRTAISRALDKIERYYTAHYQ